MWARLAVAPLSVSAVHGVALLRAGRSWDADAAEPANDAKSVLLHLFLGTQEEAPGFLKASLRLQVAKPLALPWPVVATVPAQHGYLV